MEKAGGATAPRGRGIMNAVDSLSVGLEAALPDALERTKAALKAEGFGVLTEIDVQATLRAKLDADFYPYRLLGVCRPDLAYRALSLDPSLGVFLPCTIALYDTGAGTEIHAQDPAAALSSDVPAELPAIVAEARRGLVAALARLRAAPAQAAGALSED